MLDFVKPQIRETKKGLHIFPEFQVIRSKDLMIRGQSFFAVWDEASQAWSDDQYVLRTLVDNEIYRFVEEHPEFENATVEPLSSYSNNSWNNWVRYCKSLSDNYHELDKKLIFADDEVKKSDYCTHKLPYSLCLQEIPAYEELMNVIYAPEERQKLEWAIGSIIAGDSKKLQKFFVLFGGPGTGKSTFLNLVQNMFEGYYALFEADDLTSGGSFALESLKSNPLIAIQHDGDLSKISDNSRLNSVVSHEEMIINEKYKSKYKIRLCSLLFIGTNKPVKITDGNSGLIRRLIDVHPTGRTIPKSRYDKLLDRIQFEYGGIAEHCLRVYQELGKTYYDGYRATEMMSRTNVLYNFIEDNYELFEEVDEEGITLKTLWSRYKDYVQEALIAYPLDQRTFKAEMATYFKDFKMRYGQRRSVYFGFLADKFSMGEELRQQAQEKEDRLLEGSSSWLSFQNAGGTSVFDRELSECRAQYAKEDGTPLKVWDKVTTCLKDLDPTRLHYVMGPENLIMIDFDIKGPDGKKDAELNLKAASDWPVTYAELSKSGSGIHLYYYYDGDPKSLKRLYDEDIEIKVGAGKSSIRRMLTKCNDLPISSISSGLPKKEVVTTITDEKIRSEKSLRKLIERNLRKEIHPSTRCSIDFIYKILSDAYNQGLHYDVTDLRSSVMSFATRSTNQSSYCMKMVMKMPFRSEEPSENVEEYTEEAPIVFFDTEVFKNLFVICAKRQGPNNAMITMINPSPDQVRDLFQFRLVGFNNRKYDNHILYARSMGYTEKELYNLSQRIINGDKDAFFGEAYNLSYTDIYDYSSDKKSLKKWEIELGIHHMELGLKWDEEVPEHLWSKVAEYCGYDVTATESVWDATQGDFLARSILAEWAELTRNDTTNSLTTRIIFGKDPHPQEKFVYTDLSTIFPGYRYDKYGIDLKEYKDGVKIVAGKSIYKGIDPGEGGRAIGYPGIYHRVAVLDIASMHPHSAIKLGIFGPKYTKVFENLVEARVAIKHKDFELAKQLLPERLHHYLNDKKNVKMLAQALKIAINSVYGLTSASFPNKFRDPRNVDNIVAKYGALFMINLEEEVQKRGYTVIHIKTDSIKIADADDEIIQFVQEYGKQYGFTFELEDIYSKMCLVNDAVYVAKYAEAHKDEKTGADIWWTATGTQFQVPYVFKTLFSKEKVGFSDLCETKSVTTAIYLDMNEGKEEEHDYRFVGKIGSFCPIKADCGGGVLLREGNDGKFSSVTGTKKPGTKDEVYRWLEAETVKNMADISIIDRSYYDRLVDDAVETISKFGDFEAFVADDDWMYIPKNSPEEIPFEEFPMNKPSIAVA